MDQHVAALARQRQRVAADESLFHTARGLRARPGSGLVRGGEPTAGHASFLSRNPAARRSAATISPDIAFEVCANAAGAAYRARPAYVTYRVATHLSIPSLDREKDINRAVMARTSDDKALVQDLPKGRLQVTHAFPLLPTFDALSYFTLTGTVNLRDALESYVHAVTPLQYDDPTAPKTGDADVVVIRLRAYRAAYAPDSSDAPDGRTHITLDPYQFVEQQASKDNFFFNDLVCDNATHLPLHVAFAGADGLKFAVDYGTVDGTWVVQHAHYEQTQFAPLRAARVHAVVDAAFSDFTFPADPPDPRLAP
jgi:hypothetical protein